QFGAAGGLIQSLEPPKPEPVKEPEPVEVKAEEWKPDPVYPWMDKSVPFPSEDTGIGNGKPQDQNEADPTTVAAPSDQSLTSAESTVTQSENVSTSTPTVTTTMSTGQSETLPTVASPIGEFTAETPPGPSQER